MIVLYAFPTFFVSIGLSSQPCLGALVSAFGPEKTNLDLDALQVLNEYWESKRHQYSPFEVPQLSSAIGSSVVRYLFILTL